MRSGPYQDPFATLAADRAWRADDATDDGTVTTGLPSYIGPALTLAAHGTGQAVKAVSANLGGRLTIASSSASGGAKGGYGAVALAGAPATAITIARVARVAVTTSGLDALTVAGTQNSGLATFYQTATVFYRRTTPDLQIAIALPAAIVSLTTWTASSITAYLNSRTPATVANAIAFAGTTLHVMNDSAAGTGYVMDGEWATMGYWLRALTTAEAQYVMTALGAKYGVLISA
jgi:hypothetical protein